MAVLDNQEIRKQMRKARLALNESEYEHLSQAVYDHLRGWSLFKKSQVIGLYYSVNQEVKTDTLIANLLTQGKTVVLPRIHTATDMCFYRINDLNDLEKGAYDIAAPKAYCPRMDQIDLLFVPIVAYRSDGYRLGMGKGYYDRYLAKHPVCTCGLAYSFQIASFTVRAHDKRLDYIQNEKQRLTFI